MPSENRDQTASVLSLALLVVNLFLLAGLAAAAAALGTLIWPRAVQVARDLGADLGAVRSLIAWFRPQLVVLAAVFLAAVLVVKERLLRNRWAAAGINGLAAVVCLGGAVLYLIASVAVLSIPVFELARRAG